MNEHIKDFKKGSKSKTNDDNRQNNNKKPFDKKKYRLQKYSNKYKVQQWEERRKKTVLRKFYKEFHRDQRTVEQKSEGISNPEANTSVETKKQPNAFYRAKQEFVKKRDQKKRRNEEFLRSKAEKETALQKYKEKKLKSNKNLSKKTKKGQPVMKGRLEILLDKIQQSSS